MKLTIVAATGGIGRHLLDQALAAGHDVTAVVRNPTHLVTTARVAQADLSTANAADLEAAVAGADAVLSGLGPRSGKDAGITSRGTKTVVDAMQAAGVRRLIVVSAAPIGPIPSASDPNPLRYDPGDGFFMRNLFSRFARVAFREHYADLVRMEDVLRASELEWTAVRPPRLTDEPLTATYRTAVGCNVRGGWRVGRADVAHLMLAVIDQPATIDQTIGIAK